MAIVNTNRNGFATVAQFFGEEWLARGCLIYRQQIKQSLEHGIVSSQIEMKTHPIIRLWNKLFYQSGDLSDGILSFSSYVESHVQQLHQLLYIEHILRELTSSLPSEDLRELRQRLLDRTGFASALYEAFVLANFCHEGHLLKPLPQTRSPRKVPEFTSTIDGIQVFIECKRLSTDSKNHLKRNMQWKRDAPKYAHILRESGKIGVIGVAYSREPSPDDQSTISALLKRMISENSIDAADELKRLAVHINLVPHLKLDDIPRLMMSWDGTEEWIYVEGCGEGTSTAINMKAEVAVAFYYNNPINEAERVSSILQKATPKFEPNNCNIICLEVAESPSFQSSDEYVLVFKAIEEYLSNHTKRVSVVILTMYGITKETDETYHTYAQSVVFPNPQRCLIPDNFHLPTFEWPKITMKLGHNS